MMDETMLAEIEARAAAVLEKPRGLPQAHEMGRVILDLDALVAEVRRLRALPVIATCGGCVHLTERTEPGAWLCHHWEVVCNEPNDPRPDAAPPSWCPLRTPTSEAP